MKEKPPAQEKQADDLGLYLGIMGHPKTGKSTFASSIFESTHLDPERCLYVDNHDSTITIDLPEYNKKTNSGLLKTPNWDDIPKLLLDLERKQARGDGSKVLDCIILDDLTEQSALSIEYLSGDSGMNMNKWGSHKIFMSQIYRKVKAVSNNAIFVVRCSWQGDPNQKPDNSTVGDLRDQLMQPILEGAFNAWFRYDVALLAYHEKEIRSGGKTKFTMRLQPNKDIMVENRLWRGAPDEIENPTFDKLYEILNSKEKK